MKTKGRTRNQPPLTPSFPRRGILELPSSEEEGSGRVGHYDLSARQALRHRKTGEQSENVFENKGTAQKSTIPDPSLSKEGNSRAPLLGCGGVGGGATLRPWPETAITTSKDAGNKARMSMKTNSQGIEKSRSRGEANSRSQVRRSPRMSLFDSRLSTFDFST